MFTTNKLIRGLALVGLVAAPAAAQGVDLLTDLSGARGLTTRGEGGLHGKLNPAPKAVIGDVGRAVAFIDANGDGIDDLLVGAPRMPADPLDPDLITPPFPAPVETGHAFLIFGREGLGLPNTDDELDLRLMAPGEGIDFIGPTASHTGAAVANAGDVNGDGIDDMLIGAPLLSSGGRTLNGGAYLVLGSATLHEGPETQWLAALALGPGGVFLRGGRNEAKAGLAVGGGADANGDGKMDVVVGAPFDSTDGLLQNGCATIVYGSATIANATSIELRTLTAGKVTEVRGSSSFELLGSAVAGIGDFDRVLPASGGAMSSTGEEFAFGAPTSSAGGKLLAGAVYVLRGVPMATTPGTLYRSQQFGNGENAVGLAFHGAALGDRAGSFVGGLGDFIPDPADGTPHDDLVITAPFNGDLGRPERGATYLIPGGSGPVGFDLSLCGTPTHPGSVRILGQATGEGLLGVVAAAAGDWDDDGAPELALGTPGSSYVTPVFEVIPEAGRVRLLDGGVIRAAAGGVINLDFPPAGVHLLQFGGELAGAHVGTSAAVGDLNGDGERDVALGAPGAPSRADPADVSGLAFTRTGRAHAVYGPALRLGNVTPHEVFFGGPQMVIEVFSLSEPFSVRLDGVLVPPFAFTTGSTGSITVDVPRPPGAPPYGPLADLSLQTDLGTTTIPDLVKFLEPELTGPPVPDRGLPGQTVQVTGIALNDVIESGVRDTEVLMDGFPMTVLSVVFDPLDPTKATATVRLEEGPPLDELLDVTVRNSNGEDTLADAFTFKTIMITSVDPDTGPAESGVYEPSVPAPGFKGVQAVPITVHLDGSIFPPVGLVLEVGNPTDGYQVVPATVVGMTAKFDLPSKLRGPVETQEDIRVTDSTGTDTASGIFTYLESDFEVRSGFAGAGLGPLPPRLRMAGQFVPSGDLLLLCDRLAPSTTMAGVFVSLELLDPPAPFEAGQFALDLTAHFAFLIPAPGTKFALPGKMDPAVHPSIPDGTQVYVQVITAEDNGSQQAAAISNLLVMHLDLTP